MKIKIDSQLVELAGRNWLMSQLLQAGLEVAKPERDRGIDLVVYLDLDKTVGDFVACPIQIKSARERSFGLDPKYKRFPRLLLVQIWHVEESHKTEAFAMTYVEALGVARKMGWTKTASWKTGANTGKRGYYVSTVNDDSRLWGLLEPFKMSPKKWKHKIIEVAQAIKDQ
ncbi:MAG TPA: hypothetical protein VGK22_02205 [Candidatus Angelobacter sp.]|jgi:hypothetical protein